MGPVLKMGKWRKEKRRQELKSEKKEKQQQGQTVRKRNSMGNMSPSFPRDSDLITVQSALINKYLLYQIKLKGLSGC